MVSVFDYISAETKSHKPKYEKIIDGIIRMIAEDKLHTGDILPSVNSFMRKTGYARMTIVKALEDLKARGIIETQNRVGCFVRSENIDTKLKVMLFLTSFDAYQEVLYNEIISGLNPKNISIDLYFHHCNPVVFRSVIKEYLGLYGLYIITGFNHPVVSRTLSEIPKHKLLQITRPPVIPGTSFISQQFDDELQKAMEQILPQIKKYKKIRLIFPFQGAYPDEIKNTFLSFCDKYEICCSVESQINEKAIQPGNAFFVVADNDLIHIVKSAEEKGLKIGKDIGILSYNETPMKEIIRNGMTVLSTDFKLMGRDIRRYIETRRFIQKVIPTKAIVRNSL